MRALVAPIVAVLAVCAAAGCRSCLDVKPEAYPCQWNDAGPSANQCPPGWRCGLENVCHDTDAAYAYLCKSDFDCEQGWRCSATGKCADPSLEVLATTQYEGPLTQHVMSPLLFPGPPLLFNRTTNAGPTPSGSDLYAVVLDGGVLDQILLPRDGITPITEYRRQVGAVTAVAVQGLATYVLLPDAGGGGPGVQRINFDGGGWSSAVPVPNAIDLRREDVLGRAAVAILSSGDAGYLLAGPSPVSPQAVSLPPPYDQDPVLDVVEVSDSATHVCLLGVSPSGLFYANYWPPSQSDAGDFMTPADAGTDGGFGHSSPVPFWLPLPAGYFGAPPPGTLQSPGISRLFPTAVGIGILLSGDAGFEAAMVDFNIIAPDPIFDSTCTPDVPCCGRLQSGPPLVDPCPVCAGQVLTDVRPVLDAPAGRFDIRCDDPDSGQSSWFTVPSNGHRCTDPYPESAGSSLFFDRVVTNTALPGDRPYATAHGGLWTVGGGRIDQTPLLLSRPPFFFLEPDAGPQAYAPSNTFDSSGNLIAAMDELSYQPNLGFVLSAQQTDLQYVSAVSGRPGWVVLSNLAVHDLDAPPGHGAIAFIPGSVTTQAPWRSVLVATPDGGSELVVSVFDTLYTADLTGRLSDPAATAPVMLQLQVVPQPGTGIVALSFAPVIDGAVLDRQGQPVLARAYVVTQGGSLFDLVARDPFDWRATPIPVPNGHPVGLFRDGARARVMLGDGVVDSLPSLIQLAPPIPAPDQQVVYGTAALCGQGYALGGKALYRLAIDADGGTGHWQPEPLAGPVLYGDGSDPFPFASGALHAVGNHLYVTTSYGGVVRVDPATSCP